ncbi:MAG: squalene/phytoene synthase family protein [Steroidobacteraceae bacterium]
MTQGLEGTPRYFAWLYGGERMQAVLKPLFGIETEINAALQPGLEHGVAHVRTTWWREEAQRVHGGHALHPLTRALLAQRPPGIRSGPDISGLVDIATWDLAAATFETGSELAGYCERWAQALPQVAATLAAPQLPLLGTQEFGYRLGVLLCELEMLVSLRQAARLGRLRIPLDELSTLGVAPDSLGSQPLAHRAVRAPARAAPETAQRACRAVRVIEDSRTSHRSARPAGLGRPDAPALAPCRTGATEFLAAQPLGWCR